MRLGLTERYENRTLFCMDGDTSRSTVAALFVLPDGPYSSLPGVEVWDEERDARLYPGPWPVVAHPPCERWGRYWHGGPSARARRKMGDDDGCFEAALEAVRKWGGVLEHPEASHAWRWFEIRKPPRHGGWVSAGECGGWTCCIEQGNYGHRARKATWLYVVGSRPPELFWGSSEWRCEGVRLDQGYHSAEERRRDKRTGACQRISKKQRLETPAPFRDLLLSIARECGEPS